MAKRNDLTQKYVFVKGDSNPKHLSFFVFNFNYFNLSNIISYTHPGY